MKNTKDAAPKKVSTKKSAFKNGMQVASLAKKCLTTFMDEIPPEFCYKKRADFGVIPTGCPQGYFRFLALCYKYCEKGYDFLLGVCWNGCESGYTNHGMT
jgi:hypothetical protein